MPHARPLAPAPRPSRRSAAVAVVSLVAALGCAIPLTTPVRYDYFARPDPGDAWSAKIAGWQLREAADAERVPLAVTPAVADGERAVSDAADAARSADAARPPDLADPAGAAPAPPAEATSRPPDLRAKYAAFRAERKRALARDLFVWIQQQAKLHYVPDGPIDHWATLEETLRTDGDDCDGLELLVYNALRELGFSDHEVYRAIVYRPSDGQHHMVTLWFEQPNDPWVIDPTGAMTAQFLRMSQIPDWVPLKVFDEDEEFTVRHAPARPRGALAAR